MKSFFYLALVLLASSCLNAQVEFAADHQNADTYNISVEQTDIIYKNIRKVPNETQIAIAIIESGITKYYGVKRTNDSIISIANHKNVFEIGSISKVFTATLLAGLVLDKKIASLDDNIDAYLKYSFKDGQKISFKDLSNHTSGLPRLPTNLILDFKHRNNPYGEYDAIKLKTYLTDSMQLTEERPVSYSNLGVGLLGFSLAEIEKTIYSELLKNRITSKYKMFSTTAKRSDVEELLVKGRNGGTVVPNWDLAVLAGAGGIVSSVEDLSKFAIAQCDSVNKELALTRIVTTNVDEKTNVGLGWFIIKNDLGKDVYFHNAGTGGYTSSMLVDVETKNSVIILSNLSAFDPNMGAIDKLAKGLMKVMYE